MFCKNKMSREDRQKWKLKMYNYWQDTLEERLAGVAAAKAKLEDDRTDAEKKIVSDHDADLAAVFTSFKALFDAPVDSDGKPTGNPPMYDWPVMGE